MNALRRYLRDLLKTVRHIGGLLGLLIVLLSVPGMVAPALSGEWAQGLPWLPFVLAVVSGILSILGLTLSFYGMRGLFRFGPRLRVRHRR
jgi:uncharacterized BrkB/YihY/UPF0761 family membrane protein